MHWSKTLLLGLVLIVLVVAGLVVGGCCYSLSMRRCLSMCGECCGRGRGPGACSGLCGRCCAPGGAVGGALLNDARALGGDPGDAYDVEDDAGLDEGEYFDGGGAFRLKVSDPEYTALLDGKKTVEVRLDRPPFSKLKEGDTVVVVRARPKGDTSEYPGGRYKHDSKITRIAKYGSLDELLKKETLAKVYPGKSAAEAAERFGMYLPPGTGPKDPVLAIELKVAKAK